jgi:ADP-ribose pyrophosphatase YjhB (NUDIX family)
MSSVQHTHRVAVNAFLIHEDRFLLLKRAKKPFIWGPPGGKLQIDEDPIHGLLREVLEETGLQICVFQPVTTWFGYFYNLPLLSVDYLCTCDKNVVTLSQEHNDYRWLTIDDLVQDKKIYFTSELGFKLSDYNLAWQTYLMNQKKS